MNIALQNHSLSFELVLLFDFGGGFGVVLTKCFGVGVSCRILYSFVAYLYVSRSGSITSVGEERAYLSTVFACNYVVSVRRGFLFLWVLGMGYLFYCGTP